MTLVDYDKLPLDFAQNWLVIENVFVGCKDNVELFAFQIRRQNRSFPLWSPIHDNFDWWSPLRKFSFPIRNCRQRNHNQIRSLIALISNQIGEQTDSLNRFAQAHLICQDAVQVVIVQGYHPVKPLELILLQLASFQQMGLLSDLLLNLVSDWIVSLRRIHQVVLDLFRITHILFVVSVVLRLILGFNFFSFGSNLPTLSFIFICILVTL